MSLYKVRLTPHWTYDLKGKPESGMGYQKVNIFFNDGTILQHALIVNGEEFRTKDIEKYNEFKNKRNNITHMQVVKEDVDNIEENVLDDNEDIEEINNEKGTLIMDEKQQITKFIKNLVDDNYSEANKTLVDVTNSKVQELIKNEIIDQEKAK